MLVLDKYYQGMGRYLDIARLGFEDVNMCVPRYYPKTIMWKFVIDECLLKGLMDTMT